MDLEKVEILPDEKLEAAAECLRIMAHPVRLKLVNALMQGEFAVNELSKMVNCSPNQTCEHLRLLKGHGLLGSERRGRSVYYKIISPKLPRLLDCVRTSCGEEQ